MHNFDIVPVECMLVIQYVININDYRVFGNH